MVKSNGLEWKRFYSDDKIWSDGIWHDDEVITIDGKNANDNVIDLDKISDSALVEISGGVMFTKDDDDIGSLENNFKKWRKSQTTAFFMCEAPKGIVDKIKAAVVEHGGKIV